MFSNQFKNLLLFGVVPEDGHVGSAFVGRDQEGLTVRLNGQRHKSGRLGSVKAIDLLPGRFNVRAIVSVYQGTATAALSHRNQGRIF